jgi:hypothetical protein
LALSSNGHDAAARGSSAIPRIGRPAEQGLRELVISRGKTGYVALYRYDATADRVLVLALRHQPEAGYEDEDWRVGSNRPLFAASADDVYVSRDIICR